jgi:hypothetical protein
MEGGMAAKRGNARCALAVVAATVVAGVSPCPDGAVAASTARRTAGRAFAEGRRQTLEQAIGELAGR